MHSGQAVVSGTLPETSAPHSNLPDHEVHPLFLSPYQPSQCGVATYTRDLADAIDRIAGRPVCAVAAIDAGGHKFTKNGRVAHVVRNEVGIAYLDAARFADEYRCDVVSVQYKAGLYPGRWGEAALDFAEACGKPVLATLHSLRAAPEPGERDVVRRLAAACRRVVVMAGASGDLLRDVYDVPQDKVAYIPYGAHQPACCPKAWLRHRMALPSGPVLLTFGLVGPDKGIEHAIDALPEILACCPGALYVVAGRTHPGVKAREGESYRRQLQARADRLGITDHVIFEDRFMPLTEVFLHLKSADVYVSPHTARDRPASASLTPSGPPALCTFRLWMESCFSASTSPTAASRDTG